MKTTLCRLGKLLLFTLCLLLVGLFMLATGHATAGYNAPAACVAGPHSGHITADETWCLTDSPHLLKATVIVDPGVRLTIEPGVRVTAQGAIRLTVEGELEAIGTPTQPITLTRTNTNNWYGLIVDGGSANLTHATVEYGCYSNQSTLQVINGGRLDMANSVVQECHYGGGGGEKLLRIEGSTAAVRSTTFAASDEYPIYIAGATSVVTLTENVIDGNYYDTILLGSNAMLGHDATLTPQAVWDGYELEGSLTVPPTVTLTIEPGVVVKTPGYPYDIGIIVRGALEAIGTPTQPITLTSTTGGPTWAGLIVDGGRANLGYTTVEYACSDARKSNVAVINGGQLEMADSLVQECSYGGGAGERMLYIDSATATVRNTTFALSDQYPIYILGATSVVTLTENVIDGNYYDTILLGSNAMLGQDATLYTQTAWDGYELEGPLTVPAGVTLTANPGVIVRAPEYPYNIGIVVHGRLQAAGSAELPIQFTRVSDDINGWLGLVLDGGAAYLEHATVEKACGGTIYDRRSNIRVINGGQLELADSLVQECTGAPNSSLYVENATAVVDDTSFSASDGEHCYIMGDSTLLISDSSMDAAGRNGLLVEGDQAWVGVTGSRILSNGKWGGDGVRNTGKATVILSGDPAKGNFIAFNQNYGANQSGSAGQIIATYNYWGNPSGPTHPGNPGGLGEPVTDRVLYEPWLTEPPTGTLPAGLVQAFGPNYVSSGETLNIGYLLSNVLTETLHSAVLVGQLPWETQYIQSAPDGEYWPGRRQVVWKLGDVAPGETAYRAVQVRYGWGLAAHLMTYSTGLAAAENLPNDLIDLDDYLAYEELTVTSFDELSDQELADLLAANPDLDALYQDALDQGFAYYGAAQLQHLSDGTDQVSLPMINRGAPGETIYLTERVNGAQRLHQYPTSLLGNCPAASYQYDVPTGRLDLWHAFGSLVGQASGATGSLSAPLSCDDFSQPDCLRNCLIQSLDTHLFDQDTTVQDHCYKCYKYGEHCSACANDLSFFHDPYTESAVGRCLDVCGSADTRGRMRCNAASRQCVSSSTVLVTPCIDCGLDTSQNYTQSCTAGTRCIGGVCTWIHDPETLPLEVLVAGDPNHMTGPEVMAPGQTVSYTIAFENVGAGAAYGVYVESRLPDLFDADTLFLHDGGMYFPASRTLLWDVGELAPGAGGTVRFEVQAPAKAVSGTVVVASATVYFPSVPETTPTGDVISIVQDVVAYSQRIETPEGTAALVTLAGYTPTGNPLHYQVVVAPLHGELTGSVPGLTYTPAAGFEGVDYFAFRVDDGLSVSRPATVMVTVQTGAESEPPEVLYTSPGAGAVDVRILDTPLDDGTYAPAASAWFSEPLAPATVSPDTVHLTGPGDQGVVGTVVFVAGSNRIEFRPREPLQPDALYRMAIATGVHDTSGNPLAAGYVWSFRTMAPEQPDAHQLYLPLIRR